MRTSAKRKRVLRMSKQPGSRGEMSKPVAMVYLVGFVLCLLPLILFFLACTGIITPRRPMLHYRNTDGNFMNYWTPVLPSRDAFGNWCWLDFEDPIIIVQACGADFQRPHPIRKYTAETAVFNREFAQGPNGEADPVVIPRIRGSLIVILSNGNWMHFALSSKDKSVLPPILRNQDNVLKSLDGLVAPPDKEKLTRFLREEG